MIKYKTQIDADTLETLIECADTSSDFNDIQPKQLESFSEFLIEHAQSNGKSSTLGTKEHLSNSLARSFNNSCKPLKVALLLSLNQFTINDSFSARTTIRTIQASKNNELDSFLLQQSRSGGAFDVQKIILSIKSSAYINNYKKPLQEIVVTFSNGLYFPAATGIISLYDGLLSQISNNSKTNLLMRLDPIIEQSMSIFLKNRGSSNPEVVDFLQNHLGIFSFLIANNQFCMTSDFSSKEPSYINRHWLAHGRYKRDIGELDCIKLFRLLNGLLLTAELSSFESQ